jgi:hypothetical protein
LIKWWTAAVVKAVMDVRGYSMAKQSEASAAAAAAAVAVTAHA